MVPHLFYLRGDTAYCPHCSKTADGADAIIEYFGLRRMANGTLRVQSWCRTCRGYVKGGEICA